MGEHVVGRVGAAAVGALSAAVVIAGCSHGDAVPQAGSPVPARTSPAASHRGDLPALPSPPVPPDGCGAWSATGSPQSLAIRGAHGTVGTCQRIGRTWMVTTQCRTRPGQVGLLRCGPHDAACMNGARPHDLASFTWIPAPADVGAGLKLSAGDGPRGPVFVYSTFHHGQVTFDLRTRRFTVCPHGICHW